jgi:hypothetical protein
MAEVYHFNEVILYSFTGATPALLGTYAEDVTINVSRDFFNVTDESGLVVKRYQSGLSCEMDLGVLYSGDIILGDNENIIVSYQNVSGTVNHLLSNTYLQDKGWSQSANDAIKHDIKILARTFGTTT